MKPWWLVIESRWAALLFFSPCTGVVVVVVVDGGVGGNAGLIELET